jgi:acyl-CoA dehydrogenase
MLTEEQVQLIDSAQALLSESAPVSQFRRLRDSGDPDGFDRDLWRVIAQMGWAGILVPESYGGVEFGYVGAGLLCEQMGRRLVASPFLSTSVMAATALRCGGSPTQMIRWLSAIAAGKSIVAVAVDEGRKHNPAATALTAAPHGNGFILSGEKTFVVDGHVADAFVVAARTAGRPGDADGLSLFLIESGTAGLAIERTIMVDSRNAARLHFEEVHVDGAAMLGEAGRGAVLLDAILDAGRAGVAAELLGVSAEAFERTVAFLKVRHQFGRPIGSFQALQHRTAHLYCEIEMLRSAVVAACQALDADLWSAGPVTSMAKAKAAEVARLSVSEALQMHGGMGMTDEVDVGLFMKRARAGGELYGDAAFHSDRVARHRGF